MQRKRKPRGFDQHHTNDLDKDDAPLAWGPWRYPTDWTRDQLISAIQTLRGKVHAKATNLELYQQLHRLHPRPLSPNEVVRFNRARFNYDVDHHAQVMEGLSLRDAARTTESSSARRVSRKARVPPATLPSSVEQAPQKPVEKECSWCGETKSLVSMLVEFKTATCTHSSPDPPCRECAEAYINTKASSEDWGKIQCPEYKCKEIFQHKDMQKYASKDDLKRYEDTLSMRAIESDYLKCARKRCKGGGFCYPGFTFFTCSICGDETCTSCQKKWHDNETCAEAQEREDANSPEGVAAARAARKKEEELSAEAVRYTSVQCPNPHLKCPYTIQRSHGCDHMTCQQCGWEFCIKCLAPWGNVMRYGNDGHHPRCPHHTHNLRDPFYGDRWEDRIENNDRDMALHREAMGVPLRRKEADNNNQAARPNEGRLQNLGLHQDLDRYQNLGLQQYPGLNHDAGHNRRADPGPALAYHPNALQRVEATEDADAENDRLRREFLADAQRRNPVLYRQVAAEVAAEAAEADQRHRYRDLVHQRPIHILLPRNGNGYGYGGADLYEFRPTGRNRNRNRNHYYFL